MKPTWGLVAALAVCSIALAGDKEDLAAYKKFVKAHAKEGMDELKKRSGGKVRSRDTGAMVTALRRGTYKPPALFPEFADERVTVGLIGSLGYSSGDIVEIFPNGDLRIHARSSGQRIATPNQGLVEVGGDSNEFVVRGVKHDGSVVGDAISLPPVMRALGRTSAHGSLDVFERFTGEKPGDKLLDD